MFKSAFPGISIEVTDEACAFYLLQVWKDRWFSLAEDGHLLYWKNKQVRMLTAVNSR